MKLSHFFSVIILSRLTALGLNVVGNKPVEFAAVIKADTANWAAVLRSNNARAE